MDEKKEEVKGEEKTEIDKSLSEFDSLFYKLLGVQMNRKIFIMGAPNAGKSTYLAALWHSVIQTEMPISLN